MVLCLVSFLLVKINCTLEITKSKSAMIIKEVFRFDIPMAYPIFLQSLQQEQNFPNKGVDFFWMKGFPLISPKSYQFHQITLTLLHKQQQRLHRLIICPFLFIVLILTFQNFQLAILTFLLPLFFLIFPNKPLLHSIPNNHHAHSSQPD